MPFYSQAVTSLVYCSRFNMLQLAFILFIKEQAEIVWDEIRPLKFFKTFLISVMINLQWECLNV